MKETKFKNIQIRNEEYKKLSDYQSEFQQPYWKIIKDIIEGKVKLKEEKK